MTKISNSKAKTFRRCHYKYWLKHELKLSPNVASLPMKRGLWLHRLLQAKYTEPGGWRHALATELQPEWDKLFDEEKDYYGRLPEVCEHIMQCYDYRWREEDESFDVLGAEIEFEYKLPRGHTQTGRIDLAIEDEYGVWLVEHKSHKKIPTTTYRFRDVQTNTYVRAANKMGLFDKKIDGILWNYIVTVEPKKPQLNKDGSLSKRKIRTDAFTYVQALIEYGLDPGDFRDTILRLKRHADFFRRDRVPPEEVIMKRLMKELVWTADEIERGPKWTRSIDRSCEYDCEFLDLCTVGLYGGDTQQVINDRYHVRDPGEYYADDFVEAS